MNLFAYGTLMDPRIFSVVTGIDPASANNISLNGRLPGYRRTAFKRAPYPGICPHPGSHVEGLIYRDIEVDVWEKLDEFEGGWYRQEVVEVIAPGEERITATTYVVIERFRGLLSNDDWDFDNFRTHHAAKYLSR